MQKLKNTTQRIIVLGVNKLTSNIFQAQQFFGRIWESKTPKQPEAKTIRVGSCKETM